MVNYNFSNGEIGRIDDRKVYVMPAWKYSSRKADPDVIYALSFGADESLVLMLNDKEIGSMTSNGMVMYNEEKKEKDKEKSKTAPKKEEKKEEEILATGEIDLAGMSAKVDEFLRDSLARDFLKEIQ